MKKNPLALTIYAHAIKAANDDGAGIPPTRATGSPTQPIRESRGWDPFEVWRTRVQVAQASERASRIKR